MEQAKPEDSIEQLEYLLKVLGDQDQSYIPLRILIQLVRLKKSSGLDFHREISRVNDILDRCQKLASPQNVQGAFLKYREQVELMISG